MTRVLLFESVLILAWAACTFSQPLAGAELIDVPNGLMEVEGGDSSRLPFGYTNQTHYQQVYEASQFSRVPPGGAYITRIFLRQDCSSTWKYVVTNLVVHLSTTSKSADNLSMVFAENPGADGMVVFGPTNYIPPGPSSPTCPDAQSFGHGQEINVDRPFFYDPARGNLLMDLRHSGNSYRFGIDPPLTSHKMDAETIVGDSVSRVAAFSLATNVAEVVDTTGLVTAFSIAPIPSLTNSLTTNGVRITWPTQPKTFELQFTDGINSNSVWKPYTNAIIENEVFRLVTIPFQSLKSSQFFRLAWPSGPAIPQPGVSLPITADAPEPLISTSYGPR